MESIVRISQAKSRSTEDLTQKIAEKNVVSAFLLIEFQSDTL